MKIIEVSIMFLALAGSLNGAAMPQVLAKQQGAVQRGKFMLPPFVIGETKMPFSGDIVASLESYKKAHIVVNGMPEPLTIPNLKKLFEPCSALGNYAPVIKFFYKELPKFTLPQREPAIKWLAETNNDPIFIYLYLRYCYEAFTERDYSNLSYEDLLTFWTKRYAAEILLKIDQAALNFNKEEAGQYAALQQVETIVDRYIEKLDIFMSGFEKVSFKKDIILEKVIEALEQWFLGTREHEASIPWHGAPFWLLTTTIGVNSLNYVASSLTFGFVDAGTYFNYASLEANNAYVEKLGLNIKNQSKLYIESRKIINNLLMLLKEEVNRKK